MIQLLFELKIPNHSAVLRGLLEIAHLPRYCRLLGVFVPVSHQVIVSGVILRYETGDGGGRVREG